MFLDRDGTIVEERHHLVDSDELALIPGAAEGLRSMRAMGVKLVVITNQSVVGRGVINASGLAKIQRRFDEMLAAEDVVLDGTYVCSHAPWDGCACRKPKVGLVEAAVKEMGLDARESFLVGDQLSDMELGRAVGATTLLVRTGYGAEIAGRVGSCADHVVDDLTAAAALIGRLL